MTDDPLLLMIEALSKAVRGPEIDLETADMPDIDDEPDRKPLK